MGMNVGTGGGSGDPDVMIDINTTPLACCRAVPGVPAHFRPA